MPLRANGEPFSARNASLPALTNACADNVLQHLLVERQVRHDPLETGVLVLKLAYFLRQT